MTILFAYLYVYMAKFNTLNLGSSLFILERERERETHIASRTRQYKHNFLISKYIVCLDSLNLNRLFFLIPYSLSFVLFPKVPGLNSIALLVKVGQDNYVQIENCMCVCECFGKGNRELIENNTINYYLFL